MEKSMFTFVLLCVVWLHVEAMTVNIPQKTYEVARDRNTTVPCSFTSTVASPTSGVITWSRTSADPIVDVVILTYYYPDDNYDLTANFDPKRFSLEVDFLKGKADLLLKFLKLEDSMTYECRVQIRGDVSGKTAATTDLVVLVAPSVPVCKLEGKSEYGQNINLTCSSAEASPAPQYKWQSHDVQNNPRPLDPKSTLKGGTLSLFNVSKDTSGYYICTSANKVGTASCNMTVSVMPPSMNIGSTAGIIGGVAAFLVLLAIIICCCCCRKKKKAEEEYAMGNAEEYKDNDPEGNDEKRRPDGEESSRGYSDSRVSAERQDKYEDRNERNDYDDRRSDYDDRHYDDRRSDYDDRRSDYDNRRRDYDDRRSDYDDRRSDYDDRRRDYDDRRSDVDDQRSNYSDRRDKYSDRNERYDDDRRHDDDRRYDDRRGQR